MIASQSTIALESTLGLVLVVFQIVGILIGLVSWLNLKFNDFKHVEARQRELLGKIDSLEAKVTNNTVTIAAMIATCEERSGKC